MKRYNTVQFRNHLGRVFNEVVAGEEVVITRGSDEFKIVPAENVSLRNEISRDATVVPQHYRQKPTDAA